MTGERFINVRNWVRVETWIGKYVTDPVASFTATDVSEELDIPYTDTYAVLQIATAHGMLTSFADGSETRWVVRTSDRDVSEVPRYRSEQSEDTPAPVCTVPEGPVSDQITRWVMNVPVGGEFTTKDVMNSLGVSRQLASRVLIRMRECDLISSDDSRGVGIVWRREEGFE